MDVQNSASLGAQNALGSLLDALRGHVEVALQVLLEVVGRASEREIRVQPIGFARNGGQASNEACFVVGDTHPHFVVGRALCDQRIDEKLQATTQKKARCRKNASVTFF